MIRLQWWTLFKIRRSNVSNSALRRLRDVFGHPDWITIDGMKSRIGLVFTWVLLSIGTIALVPIRAARAADDRLWSLQPVRSVEIPSVGHPEWTANTLDAFILAKLEERQLLPSPAADRRTLIRRATFDLTGVPPTPAEIQEFLQDDSPAAFARVVDRLLESKRYGERWGRHWLDVVRYADARDLIQLPVESDFREAWRYRDWVVDSFNRDLPYDQFLMQQVAGDLMQPADQDRIDADALIATGMLAIADFVPGDVDKQQMIADYVNDQIDVVGRAILGLTIACARCHDHKFDPITIEDYYSLAGIFFSTRLIPGPVKGNTPLVRVPLLPRAEIVAIEANQARDKSRIAELSREINSFGERESFASLKQKVETETSKYLLAAWDYLHSSAAQDPTARAMFAKLQGLHGTTLTRWVDCLEQKRPRSLLTAIRTARDRTDAEQKIDELAGQITQHATMRRLAIAGDLVSRTLAESAIIRFCADDQRIVADEQQRIAVLPNRGRIAANAIPVADVLSPKLSVGAIQDRSHLVMHFSGNELLQVARTVPPVGTLFVVFRPDPAGGSGQRLVGWEDAAVGQHGLGIMTDAKGSVHVILRRNGANGDVVVPAPAAASTLSGFQTICIQWGPDGITVSRNGQVVGSSKGIDSVSSDPGITALRIGGPGSGSSPRFQGDLAELRVYDAPLDDVARSRVLAELTNHWFSASDASQDASSIGSLYEELISGQSPFQLESAELDTLLSDSSRQRMTELRDELESLKKKPKPEIPMAVVVQDGGPPETPHAGFKDAHVYLRGNPANPGPIVPRGFPKALANADSLEILQGSGRKELARWLADSRNPLTARVMANRIWQHHFGVGLVPTSANFGVMGDSPSHPELLDLLAREFVKSGWSVKSMHRLIMLSSTYQQVSTSNRSGLAADPGNRLVWRANRHRLEAEEFRDSLFAIAGRLDHTMTGPGFLEVATPRRSLYLMSIRTGAKMAEFRPLFDAPDCSGIVERRNESIVAPQALFLMNDPLVVELAAALGERVIREAKTDNHRDQVRTLYEIAYGRPPTDPEYEIGLQFLNDESQTNGMSGYCRLILSTNEFMFVD